MSIRAKSMLSMVLLIIVICGIFLYMIYRQGEQSLERLIDSKTVAARQVAELLLSQTAHQYQLRIKSFINYKVSPTRARILQAFAERDRETLLRLSKPFLETLKKENPYFNSLGWVLPDNQLFLRVHRPDDKFEDVSLKRLDVAEVNRSHVQCSGFTASKGAPQFRVVHPVFYKDVYVGVLQMGVDTRFITEMLQQKLQLFSAVATSKIEYDKWGKNTDEVLITNAHVIFATDRDLLDRFIYNIDWDARDQRVVLDGQIFVLHKVFPLNDFRGERLSCLFVAVEITDIVAATQGMLHIAFLLGLLMILIVVLVFYYGFGALLGQVVGLNKSLEKSNLELEDRVAERTKALIEETEERKVAEEKLHRAEKMEVLGLMASGVAHDLNNILSGVISYPELLLMRLPEDSDLRKPLLAIKNSGLRAAAVVNDLLSIARGAAKVRTRVNINALIYEYLQYPEVATLLQGNTGVSMTTLLGHDLPLVCCSPTHLNKCIMNLVTNATEAISGNGEVVIGSYLQTLPSESMSDVSLPAGDYVAVTVKDDGDGIASEDLSHIFEPFYTKKNMGRSGTGIGLAVVWNCMEDHGGTVLVESSNQHGTLFTLLFPVGEGKCNAKTSDSGVIKYRGSGETILVVDDDAQQRDIAVKILTEFGYKVQSVTSGEAAIAYVKDQSMDLLLLDMLMEPGIDGGETFARIVAIYPEQKAVIASGYSGTEQMKNALDLGAASFLKKPYTIDQLREAVGAALQQG